MNERYATIIHSFTNRVLTKRHLRADKPGISNVEWLNELKDG